MAAPRGYGARHVDSDDLAPAGVDASRRFRVAVQTPLEAEELDEEIRGWQGANLGTVGRARVRLEAQRRAAGHAVKVRLPNGSLRPLTPGDSSLILKGVIERLAPRLLGAPGVVAISQSKRKVDVFTHVWFLDEPDGIVRLDRLE